MFFKNPAIKENVASQPSDQSRQDDDLQRNFPQDSAAPRSAPAASERSHDVILGARDDRSNSAADDRQQAIRRSRTIPHGYGVRAQ